MPIFKKPFLDRELGRLKRLSLNETSLIQFLQLHQALMKDLNEITDLNKRSPHQNFTTQNNQHEKVFPCRFFVCNTYCIRTGQHCPCCNPVIVTIRTLVDGFKELDPAKPVFPANFFQSAYTKTYSQEQWEKRMTVMNDNITRRDVYANEVAERPELKIDEKKGLKD